MPPVRKPLVLTARRRSRRSELCPVDIDARDVPPLGKSGLGDEPRPRGTGHEPAVDRDLDETTRLDHLDPSKGIAGVEPDLLVLLVPAIHQTEIKRRQSTRATAGVAATELSSAGLGANRPVLPEWGVTAVGVIDHGVIPHDVGDREQVLRMLASDIPEPC